jgi:hypothetical protein
VGHHSEQGNFFQALIQLAAANLKRFLGNEQASHKLAHSGLARLQNLPQWYMGIDVIALSEACRAISTPLSNSTPYQILLAREISSSPVNLKS